jgi:hypothetical protein
MCDLVLGFWIYAMRARRTHPASGDLLFAIRCLPSAALHGAYSIARNTSATYDC